MLRAMWRVLETGLRQLLNGHEDGNVGYSQGVSYGLPRQRPTLPTAPTLLSLISACLRCSPFYGSAVCGAIDNHGSARARFNRVGVPSFDDRRNGKINCIDPVPNTSAISRVPRGVKARSRIKQ